MWNCDTCGEAIEEQFDACWSCASRMLVEISNDDWADTDPDEYRLQLPAIEPVVDPPVPLNGNDEKPRLVVPTFPLETPVPLLPMTTTAELVGFRIVESRGIAAGEILTTIHARRASLNDDSLRSARERAIALMSRHARELGANAVLGVRVDFSAIAGNRLIAHAAGTAVVVAAAD